MTGFQFRFDPSVFQHAGQHGAHVVHTRRRRFFACGQTFVYAPDIGDGFGQSHHLQSFVLVLFEQIAHLPVDMDRAGTQSPMVEQQVSAFEISLGDTRDVPNGDVDVVVCDGFTGNVILKLTEGVAKMLLGMLKEMFLANLGGKIAYLLLKSGVGSLKHQMDSEEYGGAPFLGAKQPVIKAHGSSKAKGIKNAIRQAKICVENDLCGTMQSALDELNKE